MHALKFGTNLKRLRKVAGYTREQLAEAINYSDKSIEKWEQGSAVPPVVTVCKLARLFGVSVDTLLFGTNSEIRYLLGIDGGASKTAFRLTDRQENVLRELTLGPSNPVDLGLETTKKLLEQGVREICREIDMREVCLFAGLAGGITGRNSAYLHKFFAGFGFGRFAVGGDTENVLEVALHGGDGVAVIMGTGIIGFSQCDGRRQRIGGWGYLIDQGGSGYNLGSDVLDAALKALDGRGGSPVLLEMAQQMTGKPLPDCIMELYSGGKTRIAAFSPLVFKAFEMGDEVAASILDRNVREAAHIIRTGCGHLPMGEKLAVICGGLSRQEAILRPFFHRYLDGDCRLVFSTEPVVNGAISLAKNMANQEENYAENGNAQSAHNPYG